MWGMKSEMEGGIGGREGGRGWRYAEWLTIWSLRSIYGSDESSSSRQRLLSRRSWYRGEKGASCRTGLAAL